MVRYCLIGTFISLTVLVQAQHHGSGYHGVHAGHRPATPTRVHDGIVVTIKGDTLKGVLRIIPNKKYLSFGSYPPGKYEKPEMTNIKKDSIVSFRVFAGDRTLGSFPYHTDYVRLKNTTGFYRVLSHGVVSVFDRSFYTDEKQGFVVYSGMRITKGDSVVVITKGNIKQALIAAINKFNHKAFTEKEFTDSKDALKWLLEHAN